MSNERGGIQQYAARGKCKAHSLPSELIQLAKERLSEEEEEELDEPQKVRDTKTL
jgi:hypothetical protein